MWAPSASSGTQAPSRVHPPYLAVSRSSASSNYRRVEPPVGAAAMRRAMVAAVVAAVIAASTWAPLAVATGPNVPPGAANVVCYEEECFSLFPTPHCACESRVTSPHSCGSRVTDNRVWAPAAPPLSVLRRQHMQGQ